MDFTPNDVYARFYLATCQEDDLLRKCLSSLDLEEYKEDIPEFLDYVITGLKPRWILPVGDLIDRFFIGARSGSYDLLRDRFEAQAAKVRSGIYNPNIPRTAFIAYSGHDMEKVEELVDVWEDNGFTCFLAARNLQHGSGAVAKYYDHIHAAIKKCKALIFVSSKHSRDGSCDAFEFELPYAEEHHPDMIRIEYVIDEYQGKEAIDESAKEDAFCIVGFGICGFGDFCFGNHWS